jgi:tetratricopeptide (TPR) repeat protein
MNIQKEFDQVEKLYSAEKYEECKRVSEELLEVVDNDFDRVELLQVIGDCIRELGNITDSLPIYYKALDLARTANYLNELISILTVLADIEFFTLKNTGKAIVYLNESIEKSKELNDYFSIESCLTMLARVYYNSDNYWKALTLLVEALKYLDTQNKEYIEDYFFLNYFIGMCHFSLGNYEDFEKYYFKAFDSIEEAQKTMKSKDKGSLSIGYNPSYSLYVVCQDNKNYSIISGLIDQLFPEKYAEILHLFACEEDSYKDDTIPVLLDILGGKYPQEAKIAAIKAISYILGPDDVYFTNKLEKKYLQYRLMSKVYKKVTNIENELKLAIDKIKNKKYL